MTREKAKEMLPIIQAFAEGKAVQVYVRSIHSNAMEWLDAQNLNFDRDASYYRIKPEPKYRPFRSVRECWQEMRKHEPFGWLKPKDVEDNYTYLVELCEPYDFQTDFDNYTFADGAPFGMKEE